MPLSADVVIGLQEPELERRSLLSVPKLSRWLIESLKPRFLNRKIERNFFEMLSLWLAFIRSLRDASRITRNAFSGQKGLREFHLNSLIPKSKKKKEMTSNFSKFHAKEGEEEDDEAANARLNMLVNALKNEHDRSSKQWARVQRSSRMLTTSLWRRGSE